MFTTSRSSAGVIEQMEYLGRDVGVLMNWRPWRWFTCWLRLQFWAVASYRLERAAYLASGPAWPIVRLATRPLFAVIRPGTVDIDCRAEIGAGLMIAHPGLGIVISHHASIGERAILTGGNCVGIRRAFKADDQLRIGDGLNLGANAVVLGPILLGDRVRVGAGAVATRDAPDDAVVRLADTVVHTRVEPKSS